MCLLLAGAESRSGRVAIPTSELGGIQQAAEVLASAMSDSTADRCSFKSGWAALVRTPSSSTPRTSAPPAAHHEQGADGEHHPGHIAGPSSISPIRTLVRLQQAINVAPAAT